jgi:ATP-binding cassette subfamily F protein uup
MSSPQTANLVTVESVSVSYGVKPVLDGVSLGVSAGDRIGVVGRNGGGKSTLVKLLAGQSQPQSGRVARARGLRTDLLGQQDDLDPTATVRAVVLGAAAEHVWASDPQAREVVQTLLAGLDLDAVIAPLSGGERRRVALARLLVGDQDLLILDEPTNHLDIEVIAWLASHLARRFAAARGRGLVVVTHDRWFLDAVCDTTWEVHEATVSSYAGGYAAYVLARAERDRQAATGQAKRTQLIRKELAWLRRGPPARTSKPQFRIDAANALIDAEPAARDSLALSRLATTRLGKKVLELENVTVQRGGRNLLDQVTARFGPGDRIGILGPNGAGKTTLLRLLGGDVDGGVAPDSGRVDRGSTVAVGHLTQGPGDLDLRRTPLQTVEDIGRVAVSGGGELGGGQLLERFGFVGDRLVTPIRDLSGGERRRLQVLRVLLDQPNVLLLDEPTNDLDIDTLTVLEDFLDGWPGTLFVVSHDRYFLERVCDHIWALPGDGSFTMLTGGVEDYLTRGSGRGTTEPGKAPQEAASGSGSADRPGGLGRTGQAQRRTAGKQLARVERQLAKIDAHERQLHADLAEHASDFSRVCALDIELRAVLADKARLEEEWLETAAEADGPNC